MRVRHAVMGLALGTSLALGGIAATAQAAGLPQGAENPADGAYCALAAGRTTISLTSTSGGWASA